MRLWSVNSYKCLEEYSVPDRARVIDFDFDESKVNAYFLCIIFKDVLFVISINLTPI